MTSSSPGESSASAAAWSSSAAPLPSTIWSGDTAWRSASSRRAAAAWRSGYPFTRPRARAMAAFTISECGRSGHSVPDRSMSGTRSSAWGFSRRRRSRRSRLSAASSMSSNCL